MKIRVPARLQNLGVFSLLLILAGVVLLTYVSSQYYTMWASQRDLAKQWAEQQKQMESDPSAVATADNLTRIAIPKIELNAMVVDGTSEKQLLLGPGLLEKSARPGEKGNAVITAHRDTFFRKIYELSKGDIVTLQRGGKTFTYEVTGKKIVDPNDMSVVKPTRDPRLTLITCYPTYYIGPAPERLVVHAKLVDTPEKQVSAGKASAAATH